MRKIIILLLLINIAFCSVNASPYINPAMSLIVPGLGQFLNGQWLKGIIIAGAEIAFGIYSYNYYRDNGTLPANFAMIAGAMIAYSTIDAYIDAELSEKAVVTEIWKTDTPDSSGTQQENGE